MGRAMWTVLSGPEMVSEVAPGLRLVVTKMAAETVRFVVKDHVMREGSLE